MSAIVATDAGLRSPQALWRHALLALVAALAALLILYRETAIAMVSIWMRSETFTHAFLVPPIVLWLVWRDRARFAAITPRANPWMLLPAAGVALLWLLGELAAVNAVTQLALTALLVLAVPAVLGLRVARAAAFPLAFLFFAVPLGEFLLPILMQLTADFTIAALRLSGVPVFREGLMFVIPSGNWSVVEACSGVRYLIASFMVGTLYAYLTYRSTKRRLVFMTVALALPLLANWVRAYLIVMLGHLSDNRIATGVDHLIYGWLFFGVVIFLLFIVGARWAEPPAAAPASVNPAVPAPPSRGGWATAAVAALLALLAALPSVAQRQIAQREAAGEPALVAPATLVDGWRVGTESIADWKPTLENPSAKFDAVYGHDGRAAVGLYVGYYRNQAYERKLGDAEGLLARSSDKEWARIGGGERSIAIAGRSIDVRSATLRRLDAADSASGLGAWQWYWVNGHFMRSDLEAKFRVAVDRLLGRGDDAAVIVVYARRDASGTADAALEAFVRENLGAIEAVLVRTRSQR
jgi:exosortase A